MWVVDALCGIESVFAARKDIGNIEVERKASLVMCTQSSVHTIYVCGRRPCLTSALSYVATP